ncbi:outer membrane protein OmpK [Sulfurimonas sp. C5]|uniref:outer membrane protein OmpK n=1 Tax=Sulfurimonas sp. C5 TaxID=3036947 RepID=UPI00245528DF|nr:outer membrane protein OmpK [Sulfurimonas sp. C5]MDH4945051.1 outer membrane protein OmpK [Sulfurimonas sp. C5]
MFFSASLYAETLYSFLNASVNYFDWSKRTATQTLQRDFTYLELEGGVGWKWGEFYGYIDIENPNRDYNEAYPYDLRFALKPIFDIYIKNGFALHIQDFALKSKTFYVNNLITGFSYKYSTANFWFKPFIGIHYQNSSNYNGFNGYMTGWVFNYDTTIFGEKIKLFQWHEIEFAREKKHYLCDGIPTGDGQEYGVNGAISLWWSMTQNFTPGIQYRYADHKLGYATYQDAIIYSLKYYF